MKDSPVGAARESTLAVPAEPRDDLGGLLEAIGKDFELDRWHAGMPVPGDRSRPVLLDLRDEGLPEIKPLKDTPRPLILVADDSHGDALGRLGGHPMILLSRQWSPDFARTVVRTALRNLERVAELHRTRLGRLQDELTAGAEERGIELALKEKELSRYKEFKTGVFKAIGNKERGHVGELLRHARNVAEQATPDGDAPVAREVEELTRRAEHIERVLGNDFWSQAEKALRGRSILVVSKGRKTRRLLVRGLIGTGVEVQAAGSVEEAIGLLQAGPVDIMYVDWDHVPVIEEARRLYPNLHAVLMTSELVFENAGKEVMGLPLSNVLITSDVGLSDTQDAILVRELTVTAGKLLSSDIFGIEKYLGWGAAIREAKVTGSEQRFDLLDKIGDYASQCGLRQSLCQNLETLTDELLMNAIWDAPVAADGRPKYGNLSRQEPLGLQDDEHALVRWGSDSNLLAISVADRFGRLDRELAFRYLVKCFARREDQLETKSASEGLGLYYAFLSVSTFVINVAPGTRTEVIGLLDMNISPRELMVHPRSYLYFRSVVPAPPLF